MANFERQNKNNHSSDFNETNADMIFMGDSASIQKMVAID